MASDPERGTGNNPELLWVAFHHLGPTFINAYIVNLLQAWLTIRNNECWALAVKGYTKASGSLPAPQSGYATTIMVVFFLSFPDLRRPRLPPKFNQFFIVLPQTPQTNFHCNPIKTFSVMLLTNRQTNQRL